MAINYRADIDGLRAVAVLAVLFFHTDIPGFSGGYVGVDIFFVISGYLITLILLKEIDRQDFSIARFYERRIRRIFPALFPMLAFVILVGSYLFDAKAFKELGQGVQATTLFASNLDLFWFKSDYFAAPSLQKPLLHTWSLAVEEQFYIFFPLVLLFISRYLQRRYLLWIILASLLSLGVSIWGIHYKPSPTFYLMPTRAWELLAGSLLALGIVQQAPSPRISNALSLFGIALIGYSITMYDDSTLFPGYNAIAPVLGACLIIVAGGGAQMPYLNTVLALRPMVFIGLISYSLYLWHWPLVAFGKYVLMRPFTGYESLGVIVTSLVVATFSWKYIEQPFRGKQMMLPERKQLFAAAAAVMIFFAGFGQLVFRQDGMPYRSPEANNAMMDIATDPIWSQFEENETFLHGLKDGNTPRTIGAKNVRPSFALWGDSHAGALVGALSIKGEEFGVSGYNLAHGHALRPLLGIKGMSTYDYGIDETEQNRSVIDFLGAHPEIKVVILAGIWGRPSEIRDATGEYDESASFEELFRAGLFRTVSALDALGKKVVIVRDVPHLKDYPNKLIWMSVRMHEEPCFRKIASDRNAYEEMNRFPEMVFAELQEKFDITIISPQELLFDNEDKAIVAREGQVLYMDVSHLSTYGSATVAPAFDDVFQHIITLGMNTDSRLSMAK
ncbi:acyltransferase family protein [Chlorobium sp. N1]|uniref:acyltransferase family protein n=1 Tax=Chlorobium sp. N1 TaxID=2491138 RepID=UPI001038DF2B|nr:acyltransferase family protein [Chlorobium sp. N1]TCD48559.1 acyltransferase [Chlorobium sp. N1]